MKTKSMAPWGFSKYTIDDKGRIRNVKLKRYMSYYKNNSGYLLCSVTDDSGKKVNILVHLYVAKVFHGTPKGPGYDVCHLDDNKENVSASNLEWRSHSQNIKDMHESQRIKKESEDASAAALDISADVMDLAADADG